MAATAYNAYSSTDGLANIVRRMNLGSIPVTNAPNSTSGNLCVVCQMRPRYNKNGRSYNTCGLTCASKHQQGGLARRTSTYPTQSSQTLGSPHRIPVPGQTHIRQTIATPSAQSTVPVSSLPHASPVQPGKPVCVVCKTRSACRDYVTCGLTCKEKLCSEGGSSTMCDYCHQRPRLPGEEQCSDECIALAKEACLLCKCRPRNGFYHLCGNMCKEIVAKSGVSILKVAAGHSTFIMVEEKFRNAWKSGGVIPAIGKVFKIIESDDLRRPYDAYRNRVGNERFRYHGTTRTCTLGTSTKKLCSSSACNACNILRTSFKVGVGSAGGAFGRGVYTSSAANKSYSFTAGGTGVMIVTKVALGKSYSVNQFAVVRGCPSGYNSVVFDRNGGSLNETVVYRDDAIRPVFLITF